MSWIGYPVRISFLVHKAVFIEWYMIRNGHMDKVHSIMTEKLLYS
jgi:hypothetical protein